MNLCFAPDIGLWWDRLPRLRKSPRLVDELGAELAPDPPGQPALPAAFRQQQGELGRNIEILGDDAHAAFRNVDDGAVARQRADPELDLGEPPAGPAFTAASIGQHDVCFPATAEPRLDEPSMGVGPDGPPTIQIKCE